MRSLPLLPTTVVGSYVQPDWLVDRALLTSRSPARVRAEDIWRVPAPYLDAAQDDATVVAVRDMERVGIDIVSDGEIRRESYSNRFATMLDGIDAANPAIREGRSGIPNKVPRIVGPIRRTRAVAVRDVQFLRAATDRAIKITIPGPFTMLQQAVDEHYGDEAAAAMDYAVAVNAEIKELFAAGADVVQLDEPYMQANPDRAKSYAVRAINRALDGCRGLGTTVVHICFGYAYIVSGKPAGYSFLPELDATIADQISIEAAQPDLDCAILRTLPSKTIVFGAIDLADPAVETPETVAARIRKALDHVPAERLVIAPDCGMKYIPRATAYGKLQAMVDGTRLVRRALGAG
ncbi:MAG: 5-methyltetrahydropteroyltriglutamate--homocysteine methyltransferase [Alphaproteobacteria bacterium]|nr:5-methyltetrahydropteroyltriglutamate--homocysteine methyltransferase [Alphaproteobacteria bacterium]